MFRNQQAQGKRSQAQQSSQEQSRSRGSQAPTAGAGMSVSQMQSLAQTLLRNESIPPELEKRFWAFSSRDAKLTFLTPEEKNTLLKEYDDTAIAEMMSQFPYEYSSQDEVAITQGRTMANLTLSRSVGKGDMNERKALISQIQEMSYEEQEQPSGGIISRAAKSVRQNLSRGGSRGMR